MKGKCKYLTHNGCSLGLDCKGDYSNYEICENYEEEED
jgi:hypothetical protein